MVDHPMLVAAVMEAGRARSLFPDPDHLVLAFAEEAGEVVKAALDLRNTISAGVRDGKPYLPRAAYLHREVLTEMIQAVAMLIRLYDEGDPTILLDPQDNPVLGRPMPQPDDE